MKMKPQHIKIHGKQIKLISLMLEKKKIPKSIT